MWLGIYNYATAGLFQSPVSLRAISGSRSSEGTRPSAVTGLIVAAWPAHSVIIVTDVDVGETVEIDSALTVTAEDGRR